MMEQFKNGKKWLFRSIVFILLLVFSVPWAFSQYDIHYDTDHLSTVTFGPDTKNGFRVSVSLVVLFTTGTSVMDGFRLGGGIYLSQTIDDWTFTTGLDAYKAKQKFGLGTLFAGTIYDDGKYGGSYYLNKYLQGDKQVSGLFGLHLREFDIRFEDDLLAFPFVGCKIYDRYRSAALELRYKGFIIGTNVYTTDINGITDISNDNPKGIYVDGKQLSSPIYAGYTSHDLIFRIGINGPIGGLIGQNTWHQRFFGTPDFKSMSTNKLFLQTGVDKPFTLY